jgi:hypothetical protein
MKAIGRDIGFTALMLAIISPVPVDADRAIEAIDEYKQIEPVHFTIPRETLMQCIRLQRKRGISLMALKQGFRMKLDRSTLCRQIRKYRQMVLLDFTEISPAWAAKRAYEQEERDGQNEETDSKATAIC